jgi:hypothetical protein
MTLSRPSLALLDRFAKIKDARQAWKPAYPSRRANSPRKTTMPRRRRSAAAEQYVAMGQQQTHAPQQAVP